MTLQNHIIPHFRIDKRGALWRQYGGSDVEFSSGYFVMIAQVPPEDTIRKLPCWNGLASIAPLHGGLSNESYLVQDANGRFVVRFGQDYPFHHVKRAREVMTARAAHEAGFAPRVHYSASGVLVSMFIEGKTFNAADVRANSARIAELIALFHCKMMPEVSGSSSFFWVFHVIRDYARTLSQFSGAWTDRLEGYVKLASELEAAQCALPIVFGHNDLLPANIIDDGDRLWLIDFEYAGFSTAMFDIAGVTANSEMDEGQSDAFLGAYFASPYAAHSVQSQSPFELRRSFRAMQCAAMLREAMWAMVSQVYLKTPGVDFGVYADENMQRFEIAFNNYRKMYP
jgi:thiamine kinase-like enzyme